MFSWTFMLYYQNTKYAVHMIIIICIRFAFNVTYLGMFVVLQAANRISLGVPSEHLEASKFSGMSGWIPPEFDCSDACLPTCPAPRPFRALLSDCPDMSLVGHHTTKLLHRVFPKNKTKLRKKHWSLTNWTKIAELLCQKCTAIFHIDENDWDDSDNMSFLASEYEIFLSFFRFLDSQIHCLWPAVCSPCQISHLEKIHPLRTNNVRGSNLTEVLTHSS